MSTPMGDSAIATAQKSARPETEIFREELGARTRGAPEGPWPISTLCGATPSRAATIRRLKARRRRKAPRAGSRDGASWRSRGVGAR